MAAQPWKVYDTFKRYMADGSLDLDLDSFKMILVKGNSNAATATLSRLSEITNEVANGNGYTTGGEVLSATTWSTGLSAGEMRFDAHAAGTKWSCTASSISSIRMAVIYDDSHVSDRLVCYASLSASNFSVTNGNSLTITPSSNGIFELNS